MPKTYKQLKDDVMNFYGDTSRTQKETRSKLKDLVEELQGLISTIDDEIGDEGQIEETEERGDDGD